MQGDNMLNDQLTAVSSLWEDQTKHAGVQLSSAPNSLLAAGSQTNGFTRLGFFKACSYTVTFTVTQERLFPKFTTLNTSSVSLRFFFTSF